MQIFSLKKLIYIRTHYKLEVEIMPAPYRRTYQHTKSKGHESTVTCEFCGKKVPRWKALTSGRKFSINDPVLKQQIDKRLMSMFYRKAYICPSCARFRGIVEIGHSRKSRRKNE
jgi:small subunit ribosomal protein S26e